MSDHLAVATVTAGLRELLRGAVEDEVPGARVSTVRPDELPGLGMGSFGANVFLYQVTPNTALRNSDLPTRRSDSSLIQRPRVALDLHYLLTCFGDEKDFQPQRVLGSAVRRLHARPQLTRKAIQDVVTSTESLEGSELANQIEPVKITPLPLSLEELSKLWSVFFQTPYRLSTAYMASLILMEADEEIPQESLPVRERNVYALPFHQPVIEDIRSEPEDSRIIDADSRILIKGKRLQGPITDVRIGRTEVTPRTVDVKDSSIRVDLSTLPADALRAGTRGIQVLHRVLIGTPETERGWVESEVFPVVLRPKIARKMGADGRPLDEFDIEMEQRVEDDGTRSLFVVIKVRPRVGELQRVLLLLNEPVDDKPAAYSFPGRVREPDEEEPAHEGVNWSLLEFPIQGVKTAEYLVRVQVDGAQSVLEVDEQGAYFQPRFRIEAPNG